MVMITKKEIEQMIKNKKDELDQKKKPKDKKK
jgi:hypothetical protein